MSAIMDNAEHDSRPVAGLCNLGNTCYFNAALQAMASSRHFTNCIFNLSAAFEATAEPGQQKHTSLVQQLQGCLKAAAKFVWEGKQL
jgi:ubiquitin C-terminal hydrolase